MNWYKLEKSSASYDSYSDKIHSLSLLNPYPFNSWFDRSGRTYLPFQSSGAVEIDSDVQQELEGGGCQVTDYRGGYCQRGNRTFRIGKELENLRRRALEEITMKFERGEIYNADREISDTNNHFDQLSSTFQNSPFRTQKGSAGLMIVFSQNPHDIAQMSTGRRWTSCMNVEEEGSQYKNIFCEVERGGLVAYLINGNDMEISNPLARIHIRRFDNQSGQSIAIPEESVYGDDIPGFLDGVKGWLDARQPNIASGRYNLQGGSYSDTFQKEKFIAPSDKDEVIQWWRGEAEDAVYTTWTVEDDLAQDYDYETTHDYLGDEYEHGETGIIDRTRSFATEEEAKQYLSQMNQYYDGEYERELAGEYWSEYSEDEDDWDKKRFRIHSIEHNNKPEMQMEAASIMLQSPRGSYPGEVIQEIKDFAFSPEGQHLGLDKLFSNQYSDYVDQEDLDKIHTLDRIAYIKNLPVEEQEPYKRAWLYSINYFLDNPSSALSSPNAKRALNDMRLLTGIDSKVQGEKSLVLHIRSTIIQDIIRPLESLFQPVTEDIIQKLVNLPTNTSNMLDEVGVSKEWQDEMITDLSRDILSLFWGHGVDTPTVQNFYQSLLPRWQDNHRINDNYGEINIETLGYAIGKLGVNGRQFIPFIQEKLRQTQDARRTFSADDNSHPVKILEKNIERYLFILESLESGEPSGKYRFSSSNWYTRA